MALSANPTKTRTFEENWNREINRRWKAFTKSAINKLTMMNSAAIDGVLTNQSDPFVLDASQQRVYMAFLNREIQRLLTETAQAPNWQGVYQLQSYERGLESTRAALISQGADLALTEAEILRAGGLTSTAFTATASIGVAGKAAIHQDALSFLFNRSYDSLKSWTGRMSTEVRGILFDAVSEGKGVDQVVREMTKRISVSRSRARTIAQTEINQAYSRASISEAQRASEEIGEDVNVRWLTTRLPNVRHTHASVHGIVMTPERASKIKTTDGINCRCGLAPVIAEADTAKKREKFARERKELLALEAKTAPN
jgi:SPP1 gp7 family putative phage head morphogenesis protein